MDLDALNKYLEATQDHLGVEDQRYGGGFRAIVAHRSATDFLFDMLEGDDFQATEAMAFLGDSPLFPSATGKTPQEALQNLSAKLGLLHTFERSTSSDKWKAIRRFELKAQYDADPGEERGWYDVSWVDVVLDLKSSSLYYYEDSKAGCSDCEKRDLHALINFKYEGPLAGLLS
ncbi:hypothetical protein ACLPJG_26745 [Pseudomonas aeruginosa]|jgi:predicted RNase H-like HicB family nuclease|nr:MULTISPECIES: hypothetical protein [Pseudomonas]MCT8191235.1 hypothetical protein [Pseudomonas monteilii]RFP99730.1 hypothetical protein D0O09_21205 [Pseudomonas putida]UPL41745.1 hypothetical protein MX621_31200 [Pseudomonas aeruginosa]